MGNPSPVFVARNVSVSGYPKIVGENHLKLQLTQNGARLPAIGFRMANRLNDVDVTRGIDVAFQLHLECYNGSEYLQAKLLDLRASA
jgi:single-stranded-DNA-specific exonuclease